MTILGLKCLLENILDERLDLHIKNIRKIETAENSKKGVVRITFCDNKTEEFTIFEQVMCDEE